MTNHPYPAHIQVAVADALSELYDNATTWEQLETADDSRADVALQAMWDAGRVDLGDRVDHLPDDAIILAHNGQRHTPSTFQASATADHYPAAIVYWGTP